MSKMNQKEAVFAAVQSVCGQHEGPYLPSKEERAQINMILLEGFKSESIQLDREFNEVGLKAYVSGLVSNWLRKDSRLNGGTKYVAKNPGSRQGSTDPQIKAMRVLLSTLTEESDRAEVQAHIDARLAEINAEKVKKVQTDISALPPELAAKLTK